FPLGDEVLRKIIRLQLKKIADRLYQNHRAAFEFDEVVVERIADRCKEVESGARNVDHILTGTLLPEVSASLLQRFAEGQPVARVKVGVADNNFTYEIG